MIFPVELYITNFRNQFEIYRGKLNAPNRLTVSLHDLIHGGFELIELNDQ